METAQADSSVAKLIVKTANKLGLIRPQPSCAG
jgi:hypothetical protein